MRNACFVAVALIALGACGGDDEGQPSASNGVPLAGMGGGAGTDVGFETTVQPLLNLACNCHQSEPILMAPFSLKAGEAYGNLVGVKSMQLTTMDLVSPGNLNDSYLWHKVNDTQAEVGGEGLIMPPTIPLNADELLILERWIAAGAPL